jgi:hypothetical protein
MFSVAGNPEGSHLPYGTSSSALHLRFKHWFRGHYLAESPLGTRPVLGATKKNASLNLQL